jgi:uncharacterized RDD family membrane protein YckC
MRSLLGGVALGAGWLAPGSFLFPSDWVILMFFVVWSLIEACLLTRWGTTPGKWLFGLRVVRADGGNPVFHQSLVRAFQGWLFGWALGLFPFTIITLIIWLIVYRRHGRAWWDVPASLDVVSEARVRVPRMVLVLVYFVAQNVFNTWLWWRTPAPDHLPSPMGGRTLREIVDEPVVFMQQQPQR